MMISPATAALLFILFSSVVEARGHVHGEEKRSASVRFNVGVILDLESWVGNVSLASMKMALKDFYATHANYTTRVNLIPRDSKEDVVVAAAVAIKLLTVDKVEAIIGPQTSVQAKFVAELGSKSQTPIISFSATSPYLASSRTPYFVRTALSDSSQAEAIAALVRSFGWRQLIPIFEDTDYGTGMIPFLIDAFQASDARVPNRSMIPLLANDDQILRELYALKTMQNRVFVIHASDHLTTRLLVKAAEAGMMTTGYAWVITYGLTDSFDLLESTTRDAMQGVLTVHPYVSADNFTSRWSQNISVYALWAYDTAWAMALAAESVASSADPVSPSPVSAAAGNLSALGELGIEPSVNGGRLLRSMMDVKFGGVTGNFSLVDRQLDAAPFDFEIINVVGGKAKRIGYWTKEHGVSRRLGGRMDLVKVVWPGNTMAAPKGLDYETNGRSLKIGVPAKKGFTDFVNREWNPQTKGNVSGFCIEVFDMLMAFLPYNVTYEYIPYEDHNGEMKGSYNDLIYQVYLQNFDAVVGDVTITPNRSLYVDFTAPFTELGMSMVVPVKDDRGRNAWIFLKPLTTELWFATGAFFVFTGLVVWVLEHRINDSFRGPPLNQLGTIFYFSFSTLVFAHREKVTSNLTRIVVVIWVFVVLILTASYTASLTSMLTVQQLHPTVTSLHELIRNGEYIGYMGDPSLLGLVNVDKTKLRKFNSPDDYDEALSKGSARGGVGAIIDEIPYIKVFMAKYCGKYTMVGNIYRTEGFGFVFRKGSPFVADLSRLILKTSADLERMLYRNRTTCPEQNNSATSDSLSFNSFLGLFLITGTTSLLALSLYLTFFLYEHRELLRPTETQESSIWQRFALVAKLFDQKDYTSFAVRKSCLKIEEMKEVHDHKGWAAGPRTDDSQSAADFSSPSYGNSEPEEAGSSGRKVKSIYV